MNTLTTSRRALALAATATFVLAACGSDDPAATTDTSNGAAPAETGPPTPDTGDTADGADATPSEEAMAMAMNMGGPDVTPAQDVEGAALSRGDFALLETRPSGYDDVAGRAVMARGDDGTTVSIEISGLLADTAYVGHLHESPCSDNGGDHFQFVDGTVEVPPNEIHLGFVSDADGSASWSAHNDAVAGEDAVAFVVHPVEFIDNKIACVDFTDDDPDAVAEAIATGPAFDPALIEGMEGMNMNDMDMSSMGSMDGTDHQGMDGTDHDGMDDMDDQE